MRCRVFKRLLPSEKWLTAGLNRQWVMMQTRKKARQDQMMMLSLRFEPDATPQQQ